MHNQHLYCIILCYFFSCGLPEPTLSAASCLSSVLAWGKSWNAAWAGYLASTFLHNCSWTLSPLLDYSYHVTYQSLLSPHFFVLLILHLLNSFLPSVVLISGNPLPNDILPILSLSQPLLKLLRTSSLPLPQLSSSSSFRVIKVNLEDLVTSGGCAEELVMLGFL